MSEADRYAKIVYWSEEDQSNQIEPGDNVGYRLDHVVDVDIDWHEAAPFLTASMPRTMIGCRTRRASFTARWSISARGFTKG